MSEQDYLAPLRDEMAKVEAEITEAEARLRELRAKRSGLGRGLTALDPQWAANHKPSKSKRRAGTRIADETVDALFEALREHFPEEPFFSIDVLPHVEMSRSAVLNGLSVLQDQGRIRLDHKGGQRGVTKYYRVVTAD